MSLFTGVNSVIPEVVTETSSGNREKSDNTVNININQIYISGTTIAATVSA